jgi:2,3-dihydroxyphenylpropionate 1,2-dioxygenase
MMPAIDVRSPVEPRDRRLVQNLRQPCDRGDDGDRGLPAGDPEWDALVLRSLAAGDFAAVDGQPNKWFIEEGGHSAPEVRTWIAALAAHGPYEVVSTYYRAIPEWFAGFARTTAVPG